MGIYQEQQVACAGPFSRTESLAFEWAGAFPAWFQTTPPERIGLNGEYDYHGLQKRVEATFARHFSSADLKQLTVSQRGRVVILQGAVRDRAMLNQLTNLAQQIEGTYQVETAWVNYDADDSLAMAKS